MGRMVGNYTVYRAVLKSRDKGFFVDFFAYGRVDFGKSVLRRDYIVGQNKIMRASFGGYFYAALFCRADKFDAAVRGYVANMRGNIQTFGKSNFTRDHNVFRSA